MLNLLLTLSLARSLAAGGNVDVETATRWLDDWQLEDALGAAQELLAADPASPERHLLAAEVLHQRGQHLQALPLLLAAGDDGSPRYAALKPLVESSAAYAVGFGELSTPHFKVHFLDKDEIVAHYALPVLEAAYKNIGADLQFQPAERGEKIVLEVYPDAR
ncbi:MAG TPA: hypothetical protein VFH51_14265, partial [Myxococcota bacterium]|nr:hypothetical protein [Myxococcota bacterium]